MKKVINILESECYYNDHDFESEEQKEEYYMTDAFWNGTDLLNFNDDIRSKDIMVVCIKDEILVCDMWGEIKLSKESIELLERFYNEEFEDHFTALMVGTDYSYKEDKEYNKDLPKLWYRGGTGMYYYCWQYNYKIEEEVA